MTKLDWDKADQYQPDPGTERRDPRELRERRTLDDLIQLAALYEPQARQVQQKLECGAKVYPFERNSLAYWNNLIAEISQRRVSPEDRPQ